jgi:Apea-like HEPN
MSPQVDAEPNEPDRVWRHWRDWLRSFIDSFESLDGESGLEFCESAGMALGTELKAQEPISQPSAEVVVAGILSAFLEASANAYVNLDRPREEIEQILRDELELIYDEQTCRWLNEPLDEEQMVARRAEFESRIEQNNAKVAESMPEARRKSNRFMDFDDLLMAQGRDTRMAIFEIARVISPELLAFTLNAPSMEIHDHIPNDAQRETISELLSILRGLPGYPYELKRGAISNALLRYDPLLGTSKATALHVECGGEKPAIADDGTLTAALQIIAMDLIGTRLRGDQSQQSLMNVLQFHPLYPALIERVMAEGEPIRGLFEKAGDRDDGLSAEREMRRYYLPNVIAHWSDGSGGSIDIRHVPEHILASFPIKTDTTSGVLQAACDAVHNSVVMARALASGEAVQTTASVGLGNVTLAEEVSAIELPGMRARRPSPFEKQDVPFATQPTIVLDVDTELRLLDVVSQAFIPNEDQMEALRNFTAERERLREHAPEISRTSASIAERITQVRFAMALASHQRRLIGPIWLYTVFRNPLTGRGGNSLHGFNDPSSTFPSQVIDPIVAQSIARYCIATGSLDQSLRVGRRRILQAISERNDPIDSFIDFVIAWESLVGSSENTSYVVAAAMSLLLAPGNVQKRKSLYSQIRKLYNNRSGLVHGTIGHDVENKSFKLADVRTYADASGRLAIDAFKRVLRRPELVGLSAQERSRMILLGFTTS